MIFLRSAVATVLLTLAACGQETPPATGSDASLATELKSPADIAEIKGITLPAYEEITLENGARLILMEKRNVPLIAFHATLRGGVVSEPADRNGVASLTAALMEKGAGDRDAQAFSEAIASVGGKLDAKVQLEAVVVSGEFMARDSALMIELLADLLQRPVLDENEFGKLRTRAIQSIAAAKDADPRGVIKPYAHAFVHGDHPFGRALSGSEESLASVTYGDLQRYYAEQLGADRLILTVVGDFDTSDMAAQLRTAFDEWRTAGAGMASISPPAPAEGGRVLFVDKPGSAQTYFWIGNRGVARDDPGTPAIDLVNTLFGGRFTSMLNNALRVESGLTYGASSLLTRYTQPGSAAISSSCATENTVEAIDMALAELDKLHDEGFDERTLASGRNYILGTYTLSLETSPQLAQALGELKFYGQPDEDFNDYAQRVAAVSNADASAAIERVYPTRDDLVFVLAGDGALIREQIAKYGDVMELSITTPRFSP